MKYRNVYCIGRNYAMHAKELGNEVPKSPIVFLKPTHALVPFEGTVPMPAGVGEVHHEAEIVLRVAKAYEPGASVDDLVDRMTLGLDFTLRDVQSALKSKGQPWLAAKGFRHSAPICEWMPFPGAAAIQDVEFLLKKNGETAQRGFAREMIFSLQTLVDHLGMNYGLDEGDVIFTGTPAGVGPVADGDALELVLEGRTVGACTISMK
ncbi:fumarylacetoacetate hydrolase family protein [Paenibacillus antri]|uniref:Fumarylacetoacetate hydrolase family protein n=1 Tax=Paenibacillus antri TaxID=2582848 RepID=A0A5R9GKZ2_9BACL|nr:fumarylacetoacetate hydrolase family protein [Paenibacillus antri]TLS54314.1 fumarylacetoacetate hydrolase family protein [Paenibacillus antri]